MLRKIIDDYAATLSKTWQHDRSKTVGASEIGQCARKTFWTKNEGTKKGVKRDDDYEDAWGARIRGTIMEQAFWEPAMAHKFGTNLLRSGNAQETLILGHLSATPDALIINQPFDILKGIGIPDLRGITPLEGCFMAESKTLDPRTNLVEAKTENLFQAQVQLGLMRELTLYKPYYNVITYMDASFWSEVMEFPIEFDEDIYAAAKKRATVIMTADNGRELPAEGWIAGGKECSFCPFVGACGVERHTIPRNKNAKASPQFEAEIIDYCKEYNELKMQSLTVKAQKREVEEKIRGRLQDKGVRRIENVVNFYGVKGSVRYSSRKMQERLIELNEDIDEFASVSDDSSRLVIAPIPGVAKRTKVMPGVIVEKKEKRKWPSSTKKTSSKKKTAKKTKSKPSSKTKKTSLIKSKKQQKTASKKAKR
jgi:hypothetical protein